MQNVINDVKESISEASDEDVKSEGIKIVTELEKLRDEVKNDAVLEYFHFTFSVFFGELSFCFYVVLRCRSFAYLSFVSIQD